MRMGFMNFSRGFSALVSFSVDRIACFGCWSGKRASARLVEVDSYEKATCLAESYPSNRNKANHPPDSLVWPVSPAFQSLMTLMTCQMSQPIWTGNERSRFITPDRNGTIAINIHAVSRHYKYVCLENKREGERDVCGCAGWMDGCPLNVRSLVSATVDDYWPSSDTWLSIY